MISKTIGFKGTLFSDTPSWIKSKKLQTNSECIFLDYNRILYLITGISLSEIIELGQKLQNASVLRQGHPKNDLPSGCIFNIANWKIPSINGSFIICFNGKISSISMGHVPWLYYFRFVKSCEL